MLNFFESRKKLVMSSWSLTRLLRELPGALEITFRNVLTRDRLYSNEIKHNSLHALREPTLQTNFG